jgi:hypothetical protein
MHIIPPNENLIIGLNIYFIQVKVESSASDELRCSLSGHKLPFTQDLIEEIPTKAKKINSRFVANLLRLLYTEEYLATRIQWELILQAKSVWRIFNSKCSTNVISSIHIKRRSLVNSLSLPLWVWQLNFTVCL